MEQVQQQETKHGVYFANLSAYVSGRMVGGWLYPLAYDSFEAFEVAIKEVTRNADEVAVHDYDDFPNMGEYPDYAELYELIHAIEDSYLDNEVLIKYITEHHGYSVVISPMNLVDEAEDKYITTCDSWKEFAIDWAEQEIEQTVNKEAVQFVLNNFDYDSYARDLQHSFSSFQLSNYSVAIFT